MNKRFVISFYHLSIATSPPPENKAHLIKYIQDLLKVPPLSMYLRNDLELWKMAKHTFNEFKGDHFWLKYFGTWGQLEICSRKLGLVAYHCKSLFKTNVYIHTYT